MDQDRKKQLENMTARGLEAQHFVQFVEREGYFKGLIQEIDTEYVTAILGLAPKDTETFTFLQTKRMALFEPINRAFADIQAGHKAAEDLEHPMGEGGIL